MNAKTLILPIAGLLSCSAFGQTSVTLYGVVDAYYGHATASGVRSQDVINSGGLNSSRLGVRGSEDLGSGLKAVFTLEYGLAVDANTGVGTGATSTGRQQFAGLSGGFGTLVAGRVQSVGYDWSAKVDPFHGSVIAPLITLQRHLGNNKVRTSSLGLGSLLNSSSRLSNAVAYTSPSLGGFTAAYNHSRLTENVNGNPGGKDDSANLLSGNYSNGPLTLSLAFAHVDFQGSSGGTPDAIRRMREWGLGGSYDFGVVKLFGSYQRQRVEVVGTDYNADKVWQLSASVPITSTGNILLSYAASRVDSTPTQDDSHAYTIAYTHSFSKRTAAYVGFQRVNNDDAATVGAANTLLAPVAGGSGRIAIAGLRHNF